MQFFSLPILLIAAVAFTPKALANNHDSCTCHNGDSYNWRITTLACTNYASQGYENDNVAYNATTGRCTQSTSSDYLMGDQWETACKAIAVSGFQCADGKGTCYADADNVRGWC